MAKRKGGFAGFLTNMDIYRHLPKDMTEPSFAGATSKSSNLKSPSFVQLSCSFSF